MPGTPLPYAAGAITVAYGVFALAVHGPLILGITLLAPAGVEIGLGVLTSRDLKSRASPPCPSRGAPLDDRAILCPQGGAARQERSQHRPKETRHRPEQVRSTLSRDESLTWESSSGKPV